MARTPVLAAGGIVLRQADTPLIAVVRLRKRDEWVLPKGKLDDGETPRAAAEREVREETGYNVSVHEFLGTLVYESGGRSKVVHYWRMETNGERRYELMGDVKAVEWLPLDAAVERLSRAYERLFLANVGPLALEAVVPSTARDGRPFVASGRIGTAARPREFGTKAQFAEAGAAAPAVNLESRNSDSATTGRSRASSPHACRPPGSARRPPMSNGRSVHLDPTPEPRAEATPSTRRSRSDCGW